MSGRINLYILISFSLGPAFPMSLFYLTLCFLAARISRSALPALMTNVSGRAQGQRGVHNNSGEQLLDKTVTKYRAKPVYHKSE